MGLLCLIATLMMPGCGGCRSRKPADEEAEKKQEEPKPDFEIGQFGVQPFGDLVTGSYYKPGHWSQCSVEARANNFDAVGDMELAAIPMAAAQAAIPGGAIGLTATGYALRSYRGVALPKAQLKTLEGSLFFPLARGDAGIACRIFGRRMAFHAVETQQPLVAMPSCQYRFVVLARWPERYRYLSGLPAVRPPLAFSDDPRVGPYYRVAEFPADRRPPLPTYALYWTSIAALLWDDAVPQNLDTEQQQALLDWLHWGGQLILSGPETLDALRDSFLAPYLPATAAGTRQLTRQDLAPLSAAWTVAGSHDVASPLASEQPWPGVRLEKDPQAQYVPGCGELLVERRVGRGRVVLSAFRLSGRELVTWPGWDNFFNACLLRRPARVYRADADGGTRLEWAGQVADRFDPQLVSNLRYFTRDTGRSFADLAPDASASRAPIDPFATEQRRPQGTGVAAWNDFNAVAAAARDALRNAARIEIPPRSFVVWVVVAYLVVLVPLNWLFFRLLGRVEWAWATAPVIAVACSMVVIHLAQLDIGFVRSQTEIDVLEVQGDYPRAHLTRFTALYSSLTTAYTVRCEQDPGALAQPFATVDKPGDFRLFPGQDLAELAWRHDRDGLLDGFHVSSNATGMLHSEQMVDLGPVAQLSETAGRASRVSNRSRLTLRDAVVIRRSAAGTLETARLGNLEPGAMAIADFAVPSEPGATGSASTPPGATGSASASPGATGSAGASPGATGSTSASPGATGSASAASASPGALSVKRLVELALDGHSLERGDARLVAAIDQPLPGQRIEPAASQVRCAGLVLVHLRRGFGPDPQSDLNTRNEVEKEK